MLGPGYLKTQAFLSCICFGQETYFSEILEGEIGLFPVDSAVLFQKLKLMSEVKAVILHYDPV